MDDNINRMFPCTWYAICFSKDVTSRPIKKKIIGRDLVLFRNKDGNIQAIAAYCPHRGADLSLGSIRKGRVTCAYHGWEFDEGGTCVCIPSQPSKPIPKFAHTKSYPVIERAGLIWIYPDCQVSDEELPVLELFEEVEDTSFVFSLYKANWNAHFTRVVESVLDVVHLSFVHKNTIGKGTNPELEELQIEGDLEAFSLKNGEAYLCYKFPQQWLLKPLEGVNKKFINFVTFTPIDEEETMIFGLAGRNFAKKMPFLHTIFSRYSLKVLQEDQVVVESQHPRPIPEALKMEAHVYADAAQIKFRQRWFQFLTSEERTCYLDK
ncbi:aromatic ring-hydroxylating dioxygenase subunit alpha [Bacillus sp. TL12]|uniref:aromatic ring-hydroxylating dioxygenase subunit alpha n=1 Tax=Bacillus sp. TL12 TaxID=2894756 RepID=UPI001F51CDD4|nr:aromatic ring-hydroxylating dioxygenase subunit alpha [Bacillus sp. TL12]MCI0765481.1 aromatic ring-hydroxylating dioxygenase subunit alpha [Bacillus sp. TL12]